MASDPSVFSIDAIRTCLSADNNRTLSRIFVHQQVGSTNDELWHYLDSGHTAPAVCLSESQTAGRGRRGDVWLSPPSGNLYLSLCWPFPAETPQNGLSIAIGIHVIQAINSEGINGLQLKWPNDIVYKKHKLAGILVESRFGKQRNTVIGIGLNFSLPTNIQRQIQQPSISLAQICSDLPCRNRLAGKIIQSMINALKQFQKSGLRDFIPQWPAYDALAGQKIILIDKAQHIPATACGITEDGELQYRQGDQIHCLSNSHIRIRLAS